MDLAAWQKAEGIPSVTALVILGKIGRIPLLRTLKNFMNLKKVVEIDF